MAFDFLIKPVVENLYIEAVSVRKEHGAIIVDGVQVASTLQCVHCGAHWIPMRNSGMKRGYCTNCAGPVCGAEACMAHCVPFEKQLERMEKAGRRQV